MYGDIDMVKDMTGVEPGLFDFETEKELNDMIKRLLESATVAIDARLKGSIKEDDPYFIAISDIANRLVSKLIFYAKSNRRAQIIKYDENDITVLLNTTDFFDDLKRELAPFQKTKIKIFHSAGESNGS